MAVAVLFLSSLAAFAQVAPGKFDRPRTYDVQHYIIRIGFDRITKTVIGDTTVTLTPLDKPLSSVELDAVGLKFDSVTTADLKGTYDHRTTTDKVIVKLDRAYDRGETVAIRFKYSTVPAKGVYFIPEQNEPGRPGRSAQIWTQNEPEDARHWFPGFDFPSDKATTEEFITANADETVIGNGELLETTKNADGTATFHYRMTVPHSTYLVSFVIGKYVKVSDTARGVPLGFYVYPGRENIVPAAFGNTGKILAVFEDLTGVKFPYVKYDQTIVSGFQEFSGMENITATSLSDTEVFFAEYAFGKPMVEDLVSHELSHSWFGDMVTCKNWSELWLNEGFADFMEAASREKLHGRENYILKLKVDASEFFADELINSKKPRHALVNQLAKADNSLFDVTTYQKGGVIIHMLREEIGDAAFWKGVNAYLNAHKFANVETADLRRAMEEASGRDLKWFFDQWIYGGGYPKLDVRHSYDARRNILKLTVVQTQAGDRITPAAFRLPLDVRVTTARGAIDQKLNITKRSETFSIKTDARPTAIAVDPAEKVMLKTVKMTPPLP